MNTYALCSGIVLLIIMIVGGIQGYKNEKKIWNKGLCLSCGSKWRNFDTDSQGGRGYNCDCKRTIWISWKSIDKKQGLRKLRPTISKLNF